MKLLRNRKFAVLIAVVVIILATLLGVGRSLNRVARDVEAMFYDGVYLKDEGYTQPGIALQLNNRLNSSLGFAVLMEKYPESSSETEALLSARNALISAKSISDKYSANEALQRAYVSLAVKAESVGLSKQDRDDMEGYSSTFSGAQTAISNSRYNKEAASYMEDASFFAFLLRPFVFVTPPQIFG